MSGRGKPNVIEQLRELDPERETAPASERTRGEPAPASSRRKPLWAIAATISAVVIAVLVATSLIDAGPGRGPSPAFAREAIKVAEGNPRLLVGSEGWAIDYAAEFEVDQGSIDFVNGGESLSINWADPRYYYEENATDAELGQWSESNTKVSCSAPIEKGDRGQDGEKVEQVGVIVTEEGERTPLQVVDCETRSRVSELTFLDQRVLVREDEQRIPGEPPTSSFSLQLPPSDGIYVSISGSGMSAERFYDVLSSVYSTDVETWLAALPAEVVRPTDRPQVVEEMLEGLPLHAKVDVEALKGEAGALDRYHLGAKVSGAVACAWLDQWAAAVRSDDTASAAEATEAMSGSREWPILLEMKDQGGWSQVIWEYAAEMAADDRRALLGTAGTETIDDKTYELGPSYATGIGCDSEQRILRKEG